MDDYDGRTPGQSAIIPAEARSVMGLFTLHARLAEKCAAIDLQPCLTGTEVRLIIRLSEPMRMGKIARQCGMLPSSITATVDSLSEKGLVCRTPDPQDRRALLLVLTDDGQSVRDRLILHAVTILNEAACMSEDEISMLADLLDKACGHVNEQDCDWRIRE